MLHGACYNCDQCGANMIGKKVGSVPSEDGNSFMRVCWDCMMKHPHYSMLFAGESGDAAPQTKETGTAMTCNGCQTKIVGKGITTKDGDHYHSNCWKCEHCSKSLQGKSYGMFNKQRWCSDCISLRAQYMGDVTTTAPAKVNKAKAYSSTMTSLKTGKLHDSSIGHGPRVCHKCNKKMPGAGITVTLESSSNIYHRYCLFCDKCNKKMQPSHVNIVKNQKLCPACNASYK
jgi:hypothetical protein